MKRDMDIIRLLLLKVEGMHLLPGQWKHLNWSDDWFKFDGHEHDAIIYNFDLLIKHGFLNIPRSQGMTSFVFGGLTWQGHEFLDHIRDPEIWRETKEGVKKVGGSGIEIIGALAKGLIKKKIEQHTGVELDI
jgi:hypothetical protein